MSITRIRAFSIHTLISACVATILFLAFWFIWYPYPLAIAVGGHDIFLLLLGVDMVVGPLLTLIVFKPGKRSLKFDLTVIALLQGCALLYGVSTLLAGRPVYIAALGHRFDLIQASDVNTDKLPHGKLSLPWMGPVVTGTRAPEEKKEREALMFGGDDLSNLPLFHADISAMRGELLSRSEAIPRLKQLNDGKSDEIDRWLKDHGYAANTAVFQGLKARNFDMTVMLDARDAHVIGIAPFRPWP